LGPPFFVSFCQNGGILRLPAGSRFLGVTMSERSLPSVMNHSFSKVPAPQVNRSVFDRSTSWKGTFDGGDLIPFFVDEILPGDTLNLSANILARIQSLIYPLMDNVFIDTFWFYCPDRILWDNWQKFCGEQDNPNDPIDYVVPWVGPFDDTVLEFDQNSLADYMGLPTKVEITSVSADIPGGDLPSALWFRAYNKIWNEFFRDENLQDKIYCPTDDGPDSYTGDGAEFLTGYLVRKRGKKHDYFTSCLPFAQKGDDVSLPLGISAPVIGNGLTNVSFTDGTSQFGLAFKNDTGFNAFLHVSDDDDGKVPGAAAAPGGAPAGDIVIGLSRNPALSGMIADLTAASAATVNELREAIALQHVLESDARGGTRYTEILQNRWGVTVPDYRLQRPEYLGGSSDRINISSVAQTTPNEAGPTSRNAKGSLAAYAVGGARSGFTKSFVEHGVIIGLVNVRADISYQQGIRRMWNRRTRFDFAYPELAHLGEQAVLNKEIYYVDDGFSANIVFGYQERYAEYRYFPSQVTGAFRSNYTGTLDPWHLALNFTAQPELDDVFIEDAPPLDRVVQVPSEPQIIMDSFIKIRHSRPLPVYSVPGLMRL